MIPMIIILVIVLLIALWCVRTVNDFKKKKIRIGVRLSVIQKQQYA